MTNIEIPKELLYNVLEWDNNHQLSYVNHELEDNTLVIYFFNPDSTGKTGTHWWQKINIYEFAHKCKEWVNNKYKANLLSGKGKHFGYVCFTDNPYGLQYITKIESQRANTEPEAIFKVCEYILNKHQAC